MLYLAFCSVSYTLTLFASYTQIGIRIRQFGIQWRNNCLRELNVLYIGASLHALDNTLVGRNVSKIIFNYRCILQFGICGKQGEKYGRRINIPALWIFKMVY
jgi:hypothetical protein